MGDNVDANRTIDMIERRLLGDVAARDSNSLLALSVEGQVDDLIKEATNRQNLADVECHVHSSTESYPFKMIQRRCTCGGCLGFKKSSISHCLTQASQYIFRLLALAFRLGFIVPVTSSRCRRRLIQCPR